MKNNYEIRGNVTAIFLNSPKYGEMETVISTNKLDRAKEFVNAWYPILNGNTFYVMGHMPLNNGKRENVNLHRWISNASGGMVIDHINHNGLDNTDENMREITSEENGQNRRGAMPKSKSGVRGVSWDSRVRKWKTSLKHNKKSLFFGYYDTIEEAEQAIKEARARFMPYSHEALAV